MTRRWLQGVAGAVLILAFAAWHLAGGPARVVDAVGGESWLRWGVWGLTWASMAGGLALLARAIFPADELDE